METITKINREKGFIYQIDKDGNVIKTKYSLFKDPWTLVTICIIILSIAFYLQMEQLSTNEANFEEACLLYTQLRARWMQSNPGQVPTLEQIFELKIDGTYQGG